MIATLQTQRLQSLERVRAFFDAFGVRGSYSRLRVRNDNPFSESCFKTIKYSPGYFGAPRQPPMSNLAGVSAV